MEIKNHNEIQNYEFNNLGQYRMKSKENNKKWMPKPNATSKYITFNYTDKDNIKRSRYLHVVLCEIFIGKKPDRYEVNHIDHNTHNNNIENLEYCTIKQNRRDKVNFAYMDRVRKCVSRIIKSTNGDDVKYFKSKHACARYHNTNIGNVFYCCEGKYKNNEHHGIKYEYSNDIDVVITDARKRKIKHQFPQEV